MPKHMSNVCNMPGMKVDLKIQLLLLKLLFTLFPKILQYLLHLLYIYCITFRIGKKFQKEIFFLYLIILLHLMKYQA